MMPVPQGNKPDLVARLKDAETAASSPGTLAAIPAEVPAQHFVAATDTQAHASAAASASATEKPADEPKTVPPEAPQEKKEEQLSGGRWIVSTSTKCNGDTRVFMVSSFSSAQFSFFLNNRINSIQRIVFLFCFVLLFESTRARFFKEQKN